MSTAGDENARQILMEIEQSNNNQQQIINDTSQIDSMMSPLMLSSLSDLRNLGNSLSDFLRHWDDLQLTLNSVLSAIDAQSSIPSTSVKNQKNNSESKSKQNNSPMKIQNQAQKNNSKSNSSVSGQKDSPMEIQNHAQKKNSESKSSTAEQNISPAKNIQGENPDISQNQISLSMTTGQKNEMRGNNSENNQNQASLSTNQIQVPMSTGSGENKKSSKKVNEAQAQNDGGENKKVSSDDVAEGNDRLSELISICERGESKALKKFVLANVSDVEWLRREVPVAIGRSKAPSKLILFAMYKFYKGSIKRFDNENSEVALHRRVSMLLLEFFVASGCCSLNLERIVITKSNEMALDWRRRMIEEGGVERAKAVDALGLVLFMACFGIPKDFDSKDIYHLLLLINLKNKADVLQKSQVIREKIPDIIQDLLKKQMHIEAVNLICGFGLKEKFPPLPLLASFLQKVTEAEGQEKRERSPIAQKEFNEKQLAELRSVLDCLENNKLDYHELASFNISQRINKLVSDISMDKPETSLKRKHEDLGTPDAHQAKKPLPASNKQQQTFSIPEAYRGNISQQKPVKDTLMAVQGSRMDPLAQNMTMSPGAGTDTLPAAGGGPTMRTNLGSMKNTSGFGTMLTGATHAGQIIGNNLGPMGNINEARSHSLSAAAAPSVEGPNLGSSYGTRINLNGARSGSLSAGVAHDRVTMSSNLGPLTNINVGSGRPALSETGAGHARLTQNNIVSSMRNSHGGVGNSGPASIGAVHTGAMTTSNTLGPMTNIIGGAKTDSFLSTNAAHGASLAGNNYGSMTNINANGGEGGNALLAKDARHIGGSVPGSNHGRIPPKLAGSSNLLVTGASHMGGQAMMDNLGSMSNRTGVSSNAVGATGPSYSGGMTTGNNLGVSYGQLGHGVDAERLARGPLAPVPSAAWSDTRRPSGSFFQPPASFPVKRTEKTDLYDFADSVLEHESSYYGKLGKNR